MAMRPIILVPNALSAMRLVIAVALPWMPERLVLPCVLIGGVSDWADGFIARRWRAGTAAGALLDAIADKAFTLSVLITLTVSGLVEPWQVGVMLARDVVVASIACYALLIGRMDSFRHMQPRLAGKVTTSLVFIWFVALLAGAPITLDWVLFALAAAASNLAGMDYLLQFVRRPAQFRGRRQPQHAHTL